jgi:hypothetical protein
MYANYFMSRILGQPSLDTFEVNVVSLVYRHKW